MKWDLLRENAHTQIREQGIAEYGALNCDLGSMWASGTFTVAVLNCNLDQQHTNTHLVEISVEAQVTVHWCVAPSLCCNTAEKNKEDEKNS